MSPLDVKLLLVLLVATPFLIAMLYCYYYFHTNRPMYSRGCTPTRLMGLFVHTTLDHKNMPMFLCNGIFINATTMIVADDCWRSSDVSHLVAFSGTLELLNDDAEMHNITSITRYPRAKNVMQLQFSPRIRQCVLDGVNRFPKSRVNGRYIVGWRKNCKTTTCLPSVERIESGWEGLREIPGGIVMGASDDEEVEGAEPKQRRSNLRLPSYQPDVLDVYLIEHIDKMREFQQIEGYIEMWYGLKHMDDKKYWMSEG